MDTIGGYQSGYHSGYHRWIPWQPRASERPDHSLLSSNLLREAFEKTLAMSVPGLKLAAAAAQVEGASWAAHCQELSKENDRLKQQLATALAEFSKANSELRQKLAVKKAAIGEKNRQLKAMKREVEQVQFDNDDRNDRVDRATDLLNEAIERIGPVKKDSPLYDTQVSMGAAIMILHDTEDAIGDDEP